MKHRFFLWLVVSVSILGLVANVGGCGKPASPWGELIILPDSSDEETRSEPLATELLEDKPSEAPLPPKEAQDEPPPHESPKDSEVPQDAASPEEAVMSPEPPPEPPTPEAVAQEPASEPKSPEKQPGSAWIGEACTSDGDCNFTGGRCLRSSEGYPDGHCTQACTQACPDRPGKPVTFCVTPPAPSPFPSGQGLCVSQCSQVACRTGYACQERSRFNEAATKRLVCLPKTSNPALPSRIVLHIGDSQSCGTPFAKIMVDVLREPGKYCPQARSSGNTVFSYGLVSSAARHWSDKTGSNKDWLCSRSTVYVNGTAPQNTSGSALCSGIVGASISAFEKRVTTHKPTAFLIQLGGNSMGFSESYVKGKIRQMLDQMPLGSLCFWATPSLCSSTCLPKHRDLERWTREVFLSYTRLTCHVLGSIDETLQQTRCSSFNTSDGIHMTSCGSQLWGEIVTAKLCALGTL